MLVTTTTLIWNQLQTELWQTTVTDGTDWWSHRTDWLNTCNFIDKDVHIYVWHLRILNDNIYKIKFSRLLQCYIYCLLQPLPQGPEACPLPLTHAEYPGLFIKWKVVKECKNSFQKLTYRKEFVVWLINLQVLLQRNKSSPIQWVFSQIDQALKMHRINT